MFDPRDAEFLLGRAEFRRFLLAAIQSAGILGHYAPANGQAGRDLGHFEGRRSLGFDLLAMAHSGQPEPIRTADPIGQATLALILSPALNPKETARERTRSRDVARYDELPAGE